MRAFARVVVAFGALGAVLAPAPPVFADPAGPTDFRTEIVEVRPDTPSIEVSVEGGDSFIRLRVTDDADVLVLGYNDEPYLSFADGIIAHNVRSPATYDNEQRYGAAEWPDIVDPDAPPEWEQIGTGSAWSWHDHRAHWMQEELPIGLEPGQALPMPAIELLVDDTPVEIEVTTILQESPAWWPTVFGLLIGLQLALVAGILGRAMLTTATGLLAIAALVVGAGQYLSLSAETGPLITWWLMPALALAAAIATIAIYGRSEILERGLVAFAGVQLALWAILRRDGLSKAVLPTDVPFWFDRAVTAGVLVGGVTVTVMILRPLFRSAATPAAAGA